MFIYNVSGKKFLSEDELAQLLSRSHYTHFRKEGEPGLGKHIDSGEKLDFDNPWIDLTLSFWSEEQALSFACNNVDSSLDGSYATIEKVTVKKRPNAKGYFPVESTVHCKMKKINGQLMNFY